jgi:hypothetical protein
MRSRFARLAFSRVATARLSVKFLIFRRKNSETIPTN